MFATRFFKTLTSSLSGFALLFAFLFSANAMSLTVGDVLTKPTPVNLMLAERSIRAYKEHDWLLAPAQIAGTVDLVRAGHLNHLGGAQNIVFQAAVNRASAVMAGCFGKSTYDGFCLVDEGLVPRGSYLDPATYILGDTPWKGSLKKKNLYFDWERHSDPVDWSRVPRLDTFCLGLSSPEARTQHEKTCKDVFKFVECKTGRSLPTILIDGSVSRPLNVFYTKTDNDYARYCKEFIDAGLIPKVCPLALCRMNRYCIQKYDRTCSSAAQFGIYIDWKDLDRRFPEREEDKKIVPKSMYPE